LPVGWIPEKTVFIFKSVVIPAKAGIQKIKRSEFIGSEHWIPAFAGITGKVVFKGGATYGRDLVRQAGDRWF